MHILESWQCKPKLEIELHSEIDCKDLEKNNSTYSIYYVDETEVIRSNNPFKALIEFYGDIKNGIIYPSDYSSKTLFLIAPTQSEPKRLDLENCGSVHIASHFGALLAQSICSLPIPLTQDCIFSITVSEKIKKMIEKAPDDFLLGVLQRSLSHKIKKTSFATNTKTGLKTVVFRNDVFSSENLERAKNISHCMSMTRSLINMPANILNPATYAECVQFLVRKHNKFAEEENGSLVELEILDKDHLEALECNLICAVGQGSSVPPCLIKLSYKPSLESTCKKVALVGKGITYDTGGHGIKPVPYMRNMKKDMGGSAAALGVFFACAKLNIPIHLTCYLAVAENMISGNAMRPGDIYTAHNGLNVEIDHTDAEGRLVLADALSLASDEKPDWIIDLATLTGAARAALGPLVDPMFGNRKEHNQTLQKTGILTGDWVWNLPLPAQYNGYFDSRLSDIMNSSPTPFAGAITAALFLQKFVGSCAWNHIDTFMWTDRANGMWGEENAPTAKCVRLILQALEEFSDKE